MKKLLSQLGFTMIELLVVISVIGVLAVAVLSSINPIEQINKGRDTRTRSDSAQLINGVDRFFATQETYPWNDPEYACGPPPSQCNTAGGEGPLANAGQDIAAEFPSDPAGLNNFTGVCVAKGIAPGAGLCQVDGVGGLFLEGLLATSEVKGGFVSRIQGQTTYAIYVFKPAGANESMYACFRPSSLSFQKEAVDNCRKPTVAGQWLPRLQVAACPDPGAGAVGASTYVGGSQNELICLP